MAPGGAQPGRQAGVPGEADRRWNSILQLVLEAERLPMEERRRFIQSADSDSFVIQEALAILDGSDTFATIASDIPPPQERFVPQPGMRIGRYRVETLLGSGGSGSVYAAFDEELNRPVAIKFLPVGPRANAVSPPRHLREARAASALNHPNIIVIHEVIEINESVAIVMELVKGVTLRRAVEDDPQLHKVLRWCLQLAESLALAHAHELIHGDIKPENVMVRDDGYVKLLDFGLAVETHTREAGIAQLAGTLRYLAPERYLGEPPNRAGDIFAFGVVLYELTTGRYLFESHDTLKLLQSITNAVPERPRAIRPELPAALDELISRMLARIPEMRPTAQEVAGKLSEIAEQTAAEGVSRASRSVGVAAALIAALVALGVFFWFRKGQGGNEFSRMTVRPMASQPGLENNPSISPDGLWISCLYRARAVDRPVLQVHSTQGSKPVVIATGALTIRSAASWSPDSSELVFSALEGQRNYAIYRVSRTGGTPRRIAGCQPRDDLGCEIDWAPDGRSLVVIDRIPAGLEMYLLDLDNGKRRTLVPFDTEYITRPRFSPDGKWVAYARPASMTADDLYVVPVSGGQPRRIAGSALHQRDYVWSLDGKSLLSFGSRLDFRPQIWRFPLNGGAPSSAGDLDVGRGGAPSLARRKGSLVWVRDFSANSLWRMPADTSAHPPELLVNSAAIDVDAEWSSHGRIVFRSDRSGFPEIWIASADGSTVSQATRFRGPFVGDPHWSPDGRSIAFTSHSTGNPEIFRITCPEESATCSEPQQLTHSPATDANPVWSNNGRSIYISSSRSGRYEVWRIFADGGQPERITWHGGYMARESPDGKWLYYSKFEGSRAGHTGFWRLPLPPRGPGQSETPVALDVPYSAGATWAISLKEMFYYPSIDDPAVPYPSVRVMDLETGASRELPVGNVRLGRSLSLSADGHWILRSQSDRALTLIMIAE